MGKDITALDRYEKGGFWRVDDRSGARVRGYDTREEWNGAIVDKADWEPRHPQEFLRSVKDDQHVDKARPVPPLTFVGPDETAIGTAALAGATTINVTSSAGFVVGDPIRIALDNLNMFFSTIKAIPDGFNITLTTPLPFSAASGNLVLDASPVPGPSL